MKFRRDVESGFYGLWSMPNFIYPAKFQLYTLFALFFKMTDYLCVTSSLNGRGKYLYGKHLNQEPALPRQGVLPALALRPAELLNVLDVVSSEVAV